MLFRLSSVLLTPSMMVKETLRLIRNMGGLPAPSFAGVSIKNASLALSVDDFASCYLEPVAVALTDGNRKTYAPPSPRVRVASQDSLAGVTLTLSIGPRFEGGCLSYRFDAR